MKKIEVTFTSNSEDTIRDLMLLIDTAAVYMVDNVEVTFKETE